MNTTLATESIKKIYIQCTCQPSIEEHYGIKKMKHHKECDLELIKKKTEVEA